MQRVAAASAFSSVGLRGAPACAGAARDCLLAPVLPVERWVPRGEGVSLLRGERDVAHPRAHRRGGDSEPRGDLPDRLTFLRAKASRLGLLDDRHGEHMFASQPDDPA
ncbi:MAG TPA: hypothetical protein VGW10_07130 [Solirubrobacteraceae bacterium]|nr:hypothetical protein [Solirubrobacteraceae bacterium]